MKIALVYHDIFQNDIHESGFHEKQDLQYKVRLDAFIRQVRLVSEYCEKQHLDKKQIELTFDDGGKSFIDIIAPILEQYGFRGLFFVSTKYIGINGFIAEEDVIDLDRRGHIVGSHSHTHPVNMAILSNDSIYQEWHQSINNLSNILKKKVSYASIPNGYNSNVIYQAAGECGIKYLYTSVPTTKVKKVFGIELIGRYVVVDNTSDEEVLGFVSSKYARAKLSFRWFILGILKLMFGSHYESIKLKLLGR